MPSWVPMVRVKSTLSKTISGHPDYEVVSGEINMEINLKQKNVLEMEIDERAKNGIFFRFSISY